MDSEAEGQGGMGKKSGLVLRVSPEKGRKVVRLMARGGSEGRLIHGGKEG